MSADDGGGMVSEYLFDHHYTCSQWALQGIVRLILPPLNEGAVDGIIKTDKAKGDVDAPPHLSSKWRVSILEGAPCRCHFLEPKDGKFDVILVYFHGGAYCANFTMPMHFDFAADVGAAVERCAVAVVEHPRAPSTKHLELFQTVEALYVHLTQLYPGLPLVLSGDSSGGGIALVLAQRLARKSSIQQPGSVVLLAPWLDVGMSSPESLALEKVDPILRVDGLRRCAQLVADGLPLDDSKISPLFGNLDGLPPITLFCGTHDILLPDARRLRDRFRKESVGSPLRYYEFHGLLHCYFLFPFAGTPETVQAIVDAILQDCKLERSPKTPAQSPLCFANN